MSKDEERALLFNFADEWWEFCKDMQQFDVVQHNPKYLAVLALGWSPPVSGFHSEWQAKTIVTRGTPHA